MSSSEAMRLTVAAAMETNHDLAVRYLRDAVISDPEGIIPRFQMATILGSRGLHRQAADVLRPAALGAGVSDAGVRFLFARQLHLAGDLEAIEQYQAALILDPACEKAHLYLAQLLAPDPENNHDDVREHAQLALELRPNTSMVPAVEFVETYEMAFGAAPPLRESQPADPLASTELGDILLLHPHASRILEEVGISCAECAGYSSATLEEAAGQVGADLTPLISRLTMLIVNEEIPTI